MTMLPPFSNWGIACRWILLGLLNPDRTGIKIIGSASSPSHTPALESGRNKLTGGLSAE